MEEKKEETKVVGKSEDKPEGSDEYSDIKRLIQLNKELGLFQIPCTNCLYETMRVGLDFMENTTLRIETSFGKMIVLKCEECGHTYFLNIEGLSCAAMEYHEMEED